MKKLTLSLILGSFFVFPATQCMSKLGTMGALAAATIANTYKKAYNTNCFNNNRDNVTSNNNYSQGRVVNIYNVNDKTIIVANGSVTIDGTTFFGNCKPAHETVGSGNRTQKTTPITGSPSKVDVSFGNLTIKQGDEQSLVVLADDNIHQHLKQVVSAASIQLGVKENSSFSTKNPIEYTLTLQNAPNNFRASGSSTISTQSINIEQMKLILSGLSEIYIPALQAKKLTVDVSGASKVHIPTLQTKICTADISGASKVTIDNGSTDKQNVICSGDSSYNAAGFASGSAKVDVSGASHAAVHAQYVTGDVSGASTLAIHGKPNNVDISTSGASHWFFV